jgi:hypothetical protein
MKSNKHFSSHLARFFVERKMFQTKVAEKLETHIACQIIFFFDSPAVYEIMWKNTPERGRSQITRFKRIACRVRKATNTHSCCAILIAFPQQ